MILFNTLMKDIMMVLKKMYLKYKITQDDIDRGRATGTTGVGIVTTTGTSTNISGFGTITSNFYETSNFIQVPDSVIGIEKYSNLILVLSSGMFSIKYQLFLNDLYYFSSIDLLSYSMTKSYLEDIDFLLTTDKQVRFNKRQDRLYLDIDWGEKTKDTFISCFQNVIEHLTQKVFLKFIMIFLLKSISLHY